MEFRCATAPGKHGEKMVMRFLNSDTEMLSLDTLISNEKIRQNFRSILNEANGIIIVSGPTGSGKSTTLASALREKDNGDLNIVTAEDPIEYELGGNIQQFPVIRAKGQTFSQLLRTFLRQDPDVILIGETRDPETAESSMDAAETGTLSSQPCMQTAQPVRLHVLWTWKYRVTSSMHRYAAYWPKDSCDESVRNAVFNDPSMMQKAISQGYNQALQFALPQH